MQETVIMKLKTIHELGFAAQRAMIGGSTSVPCRCDCICNCYCEEEEASASTDKRDHAVKDACKTGTTLQVANS